MKGKDIERLAYLIGGLWVAHKVLTGVDLFRRNIVEPVKKFVEPSLVPPGPLRDALLVEIDKFESTGYLDDDIKAARAVIANDQADADQKLAAILALKKKIDTAKSYGFGDRVLAVENALREYSQKEVQPVGARVRLR